MLTVDICSLKSIKIIEFICDKCNNSFTRPVWKIKQYRKKWDNKDICQKCACSLTSNKRPQCSKEYWNNKKIKIKHSLCIKNSDNYRTGIENRDTSGPKNSMFNKKHSVETRKKMSISRTGKTGKNATAWKGGKLSLTRRIKEFQYNNGWYNKIYERDIFQCSKCTSKKRIEVHHKKPIKTIIDEIKELFTDENELYSYLIKLDIILDVNLENGITLCRECHKKEHINLGSHFPKVV